MQTLFLRKLNFAMVPIAYLALFLCSCKNLFVKSAFCSRQKRASSMSMIYCRLFENSKYLQFLFVCSIINHWDGSYLRKRLVEHFHFTNKQANKQIAETQGEEVYCISRHKAAQCQRQNWNLDLLNTCLGCWLPSPINLLLNLSRRENMFLTVKGSTKSLSLANSIVITTTFPLAAFDYMNWKTHTHFHSDLQLSQTNGIRGESFQKPLC